MGTTVPTTSAVATGTRLKPAFPAPCVSHGLAALSSSARTKAAALVGHRSHVVHSNRQPMPTVRAVAEIVDVTAAERGNEDTAYGFGSASAYVPCPFSPSVTAAVNALAGEFAAVDALVAVNMRRVLTAFRNARVGRHHFSGTTGYGHSDAGGREALDSAFAEICGAEAALVRAQLFSGTHAIAAALFAVLRPGDEMLAVAGAPYDTLEEVIGLRGSPGHGSLKEWGVLYRQLPLDARTGAVDWQALASAVTTTTRVAFVQRSCGYSLRQTLSVDDIARVVALVKAQNPSCVVVVDNCYGEFMEDREPTAVGADVIAGSLIKNPGGGIAPCGGYVAGNASVVEATAARLSAPGIGCDSGATTAEVMRLLFQGLFLAPQAVGEAVKSSLLVSEVMAAQGFVCHPPPRVRRRDIIQAVELGSRQRLLAFAQAVQRCCPVNAYVRPTAGATAGYDTEVVFADGTFIDGSTIELSCDGPLREPFAVFCQGGLHWTHWAWVLEDLISTLSLQQETERDTTTTTNSSSSSSSSSSGGGSGGNSS